MIAVVPSSRRAVSLRLNCDYPGCPRPAVMPDPAAKDLHVCAVHGGLTEGK